MKHILIVEDEGVIAETLQEALTLEGYRATVAANGAEALERIAADRPDLILLDLMMPTMNGRTLRARLEASEAFRDIPIVLTTAGDVGPDDRRNVAGTLLKPFDLRALSKVLGRVLPR